MYNLKDLFYSHFMIVGHICCDILKHNGVPTIVEFTYLVYPIVITIMNCF